jgi:steroid 5-alpha reductase family enzyme
MGFFIFACSLALECLADYQKSDWRAKQMRGEHNEKFIKSGLWAISRHPKCVCGHVHTHVVDQIRSYVAEVGVWTGIWALSTTALQHPFFPRLAPVAAAISPFFTWFLLRKVWPPPLMQYKLLQPIRP